MKRLTIEMQMAILEADGRENARLVSELLKTRLEYGQRVVLEKEMEQILLECEFDLPLDTILNQLCSPRRNTKENDL